jgi:hypothetical protein
MITYSRFQQSMIGVLGGVVLVTSIGCSTPLNKRERGSLISGGTGAAIDGAASAMASVMVGDQLQRQDPVRTGGIDNSPRRSPLIKSDD